MAHRNKKQVDEIKSAVEVVYKVKIECTICGLEHIYETDFDLDVHESAIVNKFANEMYDAGWRNAISDEYGQEGVTCPKCFNDPESKCRIYKPKNQRRKHGSSKR